MKFFIHKIRISEIQNLLCILTGIIIFSFIVFKSATASLTHDEGYTYLRFVPQKFMDIISNASFDTNNHILNTLLIKCSVYLFGNSELAIRLPNNLSLLLYLIYSFLFIRKMNRQFLILPFLLMILNPYLIDFFGLARGYGLSIGFMMMSLYHILNYFETDSKKKDLIFFNLGAFLSIFSNLAMISFYISALIIFNLLLLLKKDHNSGKISGWIFRQNIINMVFLLITFLTAFEPVRRAMIHGPYDFGGKTGFVRDTINSLVIQSYFGISSFWTSVISGFVCLIILAVFLFLIYKIITEKADGLAGLIPVIIANWLFILIAIGIYLAHHIPGMDYPTQRLALFLYPLIILNITSFTFLKIIKLKNVFTGLMILLAILTVLNFAFKLNINYYRDWVYDADTKAAMRILVQDYEQQPERNTPIRLGVSWIFEPAMNYYRLRWQLDWLEAVDRGKPAPEDNYIYVIRSEYQPANLIEEHVIFISDIADALLIKR